MAGEGPLTGVRVLEVGEFVSAPFAAKLLADFGADVIKVEPPDGDPARRHGPFPGESPDPEQSALFLYLNTSKRSFVLDLATAAGQEQFRRLAADADLIVENMPVGTMASWGLGHEALAAANPRLVTVSLTPFGQDGPYAGYAATNLTAFAMGGQMAVTGNPDQEPLKQGGYQADYQLGLNGFAVAAIALYGAHVTGEGQRVDVSAMECMASVLEASLNTYAYTGRSLGTRRGNVRSSTIAVYECADGHLGVHAMPRNLPHLLNLMGVSDLLQDERFATPAARLQNNDELLAIFMGWALGEHKRDVYERAGRMRAPVAYVHTMQDLRDSPQLAARDYWHEIDGLVYPGPPFRMSDSPWMASRAPRLGGGAGGQGSGARGSTEPVQGGDLGALTWQDRENREEGREATSPGPSPLPLAGVRVVDLTMVWAGPYGTRILGDMGAEVIKVEAVNFYDQLRNLGFNPPGTEAAWNRAAYFNHNNRNKYGLTLDLTSAEGKALLLDLVRTADVVIENYRAEVMDSFGFGYEALKAVKPDVILVSMPGHGKTGPEKDFVAYGTNIEQLAGLVSLGGYLGGEPQASGISYGDPMSGTAMAGAVALALLHRDRTGRGQYIEIAQREALMSLIGEYIVGHSINGRQPERLGNRHAYHAPHGVYPTRGIGEDGAPVRPDSSGLVMDPATGDLPPPAYEPWIAIACTSDDQFRALCSVMGRPELAGDVRYTDEASRYANQEELDAIIGAWTAELDKHDAFARLQAAGVPSGPVLAAPEVFFDRHLRERGFFERVTHADAGTWDMEGPIARLSRSPAHIRINAPRFGEHNFYVLAHLLGRPPDSLEELEQARVIGTTPNMAVHQ